MRMESLERLHRSMRSLGVDMQQFQIRIGAASFDCLFSTRETPFVLALTSRGLNPHFFQFDVNAGYWIVEFFGNMYSPLVEVLKVDGRSGERLIPKSFLAQLDAVIPRQAKASNVPEAERIVRLRTDLEEADRPYFDTWLFWRPESKKSPSHENLHKTHVALGPEALEYSKRMNASAKWSAKPTGRDWCSERK